jgi:hypothetical protein
MNAINGFACSIAIILLGAIIGSFVDTYQRLSGKSSLILTTELFTCTHRLGPKKVLSPVSDFETKSGYRDLIYVPNFFQTETKTEY